jgi:hypothetical protein
MTHPGGSVIFFALSVNPSTNNPSSIIFPYTQKPQPQSVKLDVTNFEKMHVFFAHVSQPIHFQSRIVPLILIKSDINIVPLQDN